MTAEELISIADAAALLGCHRSRIDQLVRAGRLMAVTMPPAYRRAGVKRYLRRVEVEALLRERQADTRRPKPGRPPKAR